MNVASTPAARHIPRVAILGDEPHAHRNIWWSLPKHSGLRIRLDRYSHGPKRGEYIPGRYATAGAIGQLIARSGRLLDEHGLFEINEAFAAQVIAVCRELKLGVERLNFNRGAIARGDPLGASGARIVLTLAHEMLRRNSALGIAATRIGDEMGIAKELSRE